MNQPILGTRNKLTDAQFNKLSAFIYGNFGIKLPPAKKVLLEGRLQKRLKATQKENFTQYLEYIFSDEGQNEIIHMIDQVSTNKTDFFREADHFDFMTKYILPEYEQKVHQGPLKIWSSAASSGEEIYTIAIVIEEFNQKYTNVRLDVVRDLSITLEQRTQLLFEKDIKDLKDVLMNCNTFFGLLKRIVSNASITLYRTGKVQNWQADKGRSRAPACVLCCFCL